MKATIVSDTHTKHRELDLPGGDILIHAGDFMSSGRNLDELTDFLNWIEVQDYKHKIFIAGNHDRLLEDGGEAVINIIADAYPSVTYLQDSSVTINGINFYGSPWTPEFMGWAFATQNDAEAEEKWSQIPDNTDVLITHGPAYGYLDEIKTPLRPGMTPGHLGCPVLAKRIEEINPKLHICGHIHSSNGMLDGYNEVTTYINASCLGEDYKFRNDNGYIEYEI
jgi:Icc-related predicted phosphoesterase